MPRQRRPGACLAAMVLLLAAVMAGVIAPLYGGRAHHSNATGGAGGIGPGQREAVPGAPTIFSSNRTNTIANALAGADKAGAGAGVPVASSGSGAAATTTTPTPAPTTVATAAETGKGGSPGLWGLLFGGGAGGATSTASSSPAATPGWGALGSTGATVCYPRNGTELVKMVTRPPCSVIVLCSGATYNVSRVMNVTVPKIIIGNPIALPTINPIKVQRLFDGESMGSS